MGTRNSQLRENVLNFICMIIGQKGCWRKKICLPLYYSVIKLICHSLCYYVYTIHAVQLFWTIFWNIFFEIKGSSHLIHNLLRCEQYRCIQMSLNMKFHNLPNNDKPINFVYSLHFNSNNMIFISNLKLNSILVNLLAAKFTISSCVMP